MRIGVLGTVDGPSGLSGVRLRGLLARLALDAGRPVSPATLVDDLWVSAPDNAANALQALVSRLRRVLGAHLVDTVPGGYRLAVDPDAVDAAAFAALVDEARGAAPAAAHTLLGDALALWRGPALADVGDLPFAGPAAARLEQRRATAVEDRARLALQLGMPADVDALTAQLTADPLRETTAVLLARAQHAAGRQADALATLDATIARLAGDLGVDPGPELAEARMGVLRGAERPPTSARPTAGLSSFIGRATDVTRVRAQLRVARLVTLIGPGGAGKTRLAREATFDPGPAVGSSVAVAELAGLTDAAQLPTTLLTAVGEPELRVRTGAAPDPVTRLLAALDGRDAVLVLDNCEHLVGAVAELTETLLLACPRLRVLATSREPLGVPGEVLHPVAALADADAVRLFADRAAAVAPAFVLDGTTRADVEEICRRLDGQPLPIELAAARLRTLTTAEIASRLDDRFRLLTTGARTAMPRHQTLRAVVDWSWELCTERERAVARQLAVFAGGATLAAAERVCGPDALDGLTSLVDKSLVVAVPRADGPTRYRMLETIRVYAGEKLDAAGERAAAEAAHAAFLLELVEAAEPGLRGRDQLRWLARLRAEADEIDLALQRAVGRDPVTAYRMTTALMWSWLIRGQVEQAQRWSTALPALDDPADHPTDHPADHGGTAVPAATRALATAYLALVQLGTGGSETARACADQALALVANQPEPWHPVLQLLGPVLAVFDRRDQEPLRQLAAQTTDPWVRAMATIIQAQIADNDGDLDRAHSLTRVAHVEFLALGDRFGLGIAVHSLGDQEDLAGNYAAAVTAYDEATTLARELGNEEDLPQYLVRRAMLEARRGDLEAARVLLDQTPEPPKGMFGPAGMVASMRARIERMAGRLDIARTLLVDAAPAVGEEVSIARAQRVANHADIAALIELSTGDLDAARTWVGRAVEAAAAAEDGPVSATVAETAAQLAHAEGDDRAAAALLGVAAGQRGTLDLGSPDVLALLATLRSALGPPADELIDRWRTTPRADGMARLVAFAGP